MDTPQPGQWYALRPTNDYVYILKVDVGVITYRLFSGDGDIRERDWTYPTDCFMKGSLGVRFLLVMEPSFLITEGMLPHFTEASKPQHSLLHAPMDVEAENRKDDEIMRKMLFE